MKKLGELRVGDPFYLLHYNGGYCELIEERLVGIITKIKIGSIIKWLDEEGYIHGFTLEKKEYDKEDCTAAYCTIACASKERAKQLLDNDYRRFMDKYNKNIKVLDKTKVERRNMTKKQIKELLKYIEDRENDMYKYDSSPYKLIDDIKNKLNENLLINKNE